MSSPIMVAPLNSQFDPRCRQPGFTDAAENRQESASTECWEYAEVRNVFHNRVVSGIY